MHERLTFRLHDQSKAFEKLWDPFFSYCILVRNQMAQSSQKLWVTTEQSLHNTQKYFRHPVVYGNVWGEPQPSTFVMICRHKCFSVLNPPKIACKNKAVKGKGQPCRYLLELTGHLASRDCCSVVRWPCQKSTTWHSQPAHSAGSCAITT